MQAIQYVKSVPRFLVTRLLGRYWNRIYTSSLGCIRLADIRPPELPGAQWVRVRPLLSGICGSDIAAVTAQGSTYFSPFLSFPFVLGHEVVGVVEEVASDSINFQIGDRVVLEPPLNCQVRGIEEWCSQCRQGHPARCENITRGSLSAGIQTGYCRDTGGGWSHSLVAHFSQLHRVPDHLTDEEAVLAEPFSCALHAAGRVELEESHTALIIGFGSVGVLTLVALRCLGNRCRIVVAAKHPHQRELALSLGANQAVPPGRLAEQAQELLGAERFKPDIGRPVFIGGADATFDCVASEHTIDQSLRLTRSGGVVVLVGMPAVPRNVDWTSIWHKELLVAGSYTFTPGTFSKALQYMVSLEGRLKGIVGARYPLIHYRTALDCAMNTGRSKVTKTVFQIA